jgi:hypothetical protein
MSRNSMYPNQPMYVDRNVVLNGSGSGSSQRGYGIPLR